MNARCLQYKKTSHFFHFVLTILTGGFWIIPWIVFWAVNNNHNDKVDSRMWDIANRNR